MQRRAASPLIIPPTRVPAAGNFWWSYLIAEEETSFSCLISLNVTASRGLHIGRRELMTPWLTFTLQTGLTLGVMLPVAAYLGKDAVSYFLELVFFSRPVCSTPEAVHRLALRWLSRFLFLEWFSFSNMRLFPTSDCYLAQRNSLFLVG